jgi:hypothetical protein
MLMFPQLEVSREQSRRKLRELSGVIIGTIKKKTELRSLTNPGGGSQNFTGAGPAA